MTKSPKKVDKLRLIAIFILLLGITYFHLNIFLPSAIPFIFKAGVMERPFTVLVIGTDITFNADTGQKNMEKGRTDTIILMRIDPLKNRINMVSIPRDSYVEIPGYYPQKINAAYVYGGIELTEQTIENITGLKIDKYLIINTKGIVKLVNLLGGVEIDVPKDMYYTDNAQDLFINLKKGKQKLNGKQAEGFVRFRHDALGDLGRIERQQLFIKALSHKLASLGSLVKSPFIIEIIMNNIRTNLSIKDFVLLANTARMMPSKNINPITLPGTTTNNEAGSVVILDGFEMKKILKELF